MPSWISPHTLAEINAASRQTASALIGVLFTALGDDWIEATVPLDGRTQDGHGRMHSGAISILAETLGSVGANMSVDTTAEACLGQLLHLQFRAQVDRGPVSARAAPVWISRDSQLWEIQVRDGTGSRVCVAQLTVAVIARPPAAAR